MKLKIAYIHGRPSGHPTHALYANSIGSTFFHEDRILRWQDLNSSKPRRYLSWILNALFFKNKRTWNVFFTDSFRPPQYFLKKFRLISRNQKLIALMADETLYFCYKNRYPLLTKKLMLNFWKTCDGIICIGEFQTEILKKLIPIEHHHKIYTTFNGVPTNRFISLENIQPKLESKNILFVGNVTSIWRAEYKGLNIAIKAFKMSLRVEPELRFTIIGEYSSQVKSFLLEGLSNKISDKITFTGKVNDINKYYEESSLYLHCAKGEAWGISINEALRAGIPTIISSQTGAKECVFKVSPSLIIEPKSDQISKAIVNYFNLSLIEKKELSRKSKIVSNQYSESDAIANFKLTFDNLISYLGLKV